MSAQGNVSEQGRCPWGLVASGFFICILGARQAQTTQLFLRGPGHPHAPLRLSWDAVLCAHAADPIEVSCQGGQSSQYLAQGQSYVAVAAAAGSARRPGPHWHGWRLSELAGGNRWPQVRPTQVSRPGGRQLQQHRLASIRPVQRDCLQVREQAGPSAGAVQLALPRHPPRDRFASLGSVKA